MQLIIGSLIALLVGWAVGALAMRLGAWIGRKLAGDPKAEG